MMAGMAPEFLDFRGSAGRFGSRGHRNLTRNENAHLIDPFSAPEVPWRPFSCPVFDFAIRDFQLFWNLKNSYSLRPYGPGTLKIEFSVSFYTSWYLFHPKKMDFRKIIQKARVLFLKASVEKENFIFP